MRGDTLISLWFWIFPWVALKMSIFHSFKVMPIRVKCGFNTFFSLMFGKRYIIAAKCKLNVAVVNLVMWKLLKSAKDFTSFQGLMSISSSQARRIGWITAKVWIIFSQLTDYSSNKIRKTQNEHLINVS